MSDGFGQSSSASVKLAASSLQSLAICAGSWASSTPTRWPEMSRPRPTRIGFQYESDVVQPWKDLGKRFREFSLELHSDQIHLTEFDRFTSEWTKESGGATGNRSNHDPYSDSPVERLG